ncbi:MAG: choice-of-anchor D domain-containing protein [Candidatus Aminicenantes bacterium]|nr:choice-of-anchor D domain-containing protein [Candidatus Aminicenantes bacterium]
MSQKRIVSDPGVTAAVWDFTYPTYQGVAMGTVQVQGPVYTTSATYNAYTTSTLWKIGLIASHQAADGSFSDSYEWTYQQISSTNWMVLGTNMGAAKGPLASSVIENRIGDASSKTEYLYERTEVKRYGLPTRINNYIGASGPLKNATYLIYYYEAHPGFKSRHMMDFISQEAIRSSQSQLVKKMDTSYYEETGKWGALKQVTHWKTGSTYLTWDYEYESPNPSTVTVKVDPPGVAEKETTGYNYGVQNSSSAPDYSRLTRTINYRDSSVAGEKRQDEGIMVYSYDNLGRITDIELTGNYNDIHYDWPSGANHMTVTREDAINGDNTVTRYWDGMGRDLGSTEEGEGIALTLHSQRTLDAEGRVLTESKGSTDDDHVYTYAYNAAGQITSITDPRGEETTISYQGTAKTVTDPEGHSTVYVYGDLPGLPTQVTDAMGKTALYSYDAAGRLTQVVFNGTRTHTYTYDGLDNVLTESHPETGSIAYAYNSENLLSSKTWGGSTLGFDYDLSRRLYRTTATTGGPIDVVNYTFNSVTGRVESIVDSTTGWRRENIVYNPFGRLTSERITIPGLAPKTMVYSYDWNNNPTGWKESSNPNTGVTVGHSSLDAPSSVSFNQSAVVNGASYGPNKMPASISFGNGTAYSASYNNAGMPTSVSLNRGSTMLYDAGYEYDGAGNILSIASTAPALTASFGYDALDRLISAAYSSGSPSTYSYQYDEYGNMLNATGGIGFPHTYNNKNQVPQSEGFYYDPRGNLLTSGGNIYYWDAQNRLQYIQNTSGAVIGKYLYDDRGLRLSALPPLPEVDIRHDEVAIPSGGEAYFTAAVGQTFDETLTIRNLGDANLSLGSVAITDDPEDNFDLVQPSTPVLPGGSASLAVSFHPRSAGHKVALLHVPSTDVDEADYEITLCGNYAPEIEILQAPDGDDWDYGEIEIGQYWDQTFTIRNLGEKDLILSGDPVVVLEGPDTDCFEVISQPYAYPETPPVTIAPGGTRSFVVRFSANSEGLKTVSFSIVNSDWSENPYDVTLTGTGIIGPNKIAEDTAFVITSPAEGDVLAAGSFQTVAWRGAPETKEVRLEYSADSGTSFRTIADRAPNSGNFDWLVPPEVSGLCLIRVSAADGRPAQGETLMVGFKLKIPSEVETGSPAISIRASFPDLPTMSAWTAELTLSGDPMRQAATVKLNAAAADAGALEAFLDRWHTIGLVLRPLAQSATLVLDGRPVLDGIPLVQTAWAGASPEVMVRTAGHEVRLEDFEARYKDLVLKPKTAGEDVSQTLSKDSFEGYETGTFPAPGGWWTPESQVMDPAVLTFGTAVIDEADSATGFRSLFIRTDGTKELVLTKRLSLPGRVPFGVSEESFSIGMGQVPAQSQLVSRSRLVDELWREREGEGIETLADRTQEVPRDVAGSVSKAGLSDGPQSGTAKIMSASPVGNFYIYSFDGKLLQVYDVFGTLLKDYIYMGSRLVAEYEHVGARLLYYTPDQINTTRVVTDQNGNMVYSAVHDPYGGIQQTLVSTYDPQLKFSGKERDAESQLDYFGARYYDRNIYRFISPDPIRPPNSLIYNTIGMNYYSYCADNPLSCLDPDGRELVRVALPGIAKGGTAETVHSWLDSHFADNVGEFISCCHNLGVDVRITSAYRSIAHQKNINSEVPNSLHSAGWAIDINWNSLDDDSQMLVLIAARLSGLQSGMDFSPDPTSKKWDPVHFYSEPNGDRAALIKTAAMTVTNYLAFGITGLSSTELWILYGVFTEQAAWRVFGGAEKDLTSSKK